MMHAQPQQQNFTEGQHEEESLKFLEIFSTHYPDIDKNYRLFWRTVLEECKKENIFLGASVVQLYTTIWPNFVEKARVNFHNNCLTKIDQIVMDISKTRNPHLWGPPIANKNARARAIRGFNPPKVKIIEPQPVVAKSRGRKRKEPTDAAVASIPLAPVVKVPKPRKSQQSTKQQVMNTDGQTPTTSKPRQVRRRKRQQLLPPILEAQSSDLPGPSGFKAPPTPVLQNPTSLSTIAALLRTLSSAQSAAAAASSSTATPIAQSFLPSLFSLTTPASIAPTPQIPRPPYPTPASAALTTATPEIPKPPHPTPATPFTPFSSVAPLMESIFNNLQRLPPPPEPPILVKEDIEPPPVMIDSPVTPVTPKIDENFNPFLPSSSFHLKLSSDEEEDEDIAPNSSANVDNEEKEKTN